ncbi:MAG: protoheme farnesyltransferase [Acidimicrobiales bacterium]|nr:protoheme farnesyltransferase [Acidimicrobiales bacterium]
MSRLAKLSLVTTVLTFLAVTAGGLVRASGSGLGCPGWPKCYGRWIPPADEHAIIEMTHRYFVSASIWAAVAVCVSVVVWHRRDRVALRLGLAIVPLFVAQAVLGAYVVHRELVAWTVVAHLALAMIVMATLIALTVHLSPGEPAPVEDRDRSLLRLIGVTAVAAYGLLLLGSYVTGRGAGLAFKDWPLMDGTAVPPHLDTALPFLQFSHRILAALVGVLAAWVVVRAWRTGPGIVRRIGVLLGSLFVIEIVMGGVNVFSRLHAASVTTHLALGAAIWSTLVALWAVARRTPTNLASHSDELGALVHSTGAPTHQSREEGGANRDKVGATGKVGAKGKVGAYLALTKPRIIELLLVTTVPR